MSPFHFQRSFKATMAVTPKEYVDAFRFKSLKSSLRTSTNVVEAIYSAGFGSSSRVYERAGTRLGMTPKQYRKGGYEITIKYVAIPTAIGWMMVGATERGLCFVQFSDRREELLALLKREYPAAHIEPMPKPFPPKVVKWTRSFQEHLADNRPSLNVPLDVHSTAFQLRVWNYLRSIL